MHIGTKVTPSHLDATPRAHRLPAPVKVTHNSQSAADHVTPTDNYTIVKKLVSSRLYHTRPIGHAQREPCRQLLLPHACWQIAPQKKDPGE